MISPCFSPRGTFPNPYKNYVGYRSCFLSVFLHYEVVTEMSELRCHTQDPKNPTLLAASSHILSTSNKFLLPIFPQPPYLVGWNMGQAAEGCFKQAQELQWSFQTPEGSNAALCWLNAGVKKQDCSCWYHVSSGVSCHRDGCQPSIHSDCTASHSKW